MALQFLEGFCNWTQKNGGSTKELCHARNYFRLFYGDTKKWIFYLQTIVVVGINWSNENREPKIENKSKENIGL